MSGRESRLEDHINNYAKPEQSTVEMVQSEQIQKSSGSSLSHYLCDLDESVSDQLNRDMLVELKNGVLS